MDKRILAAQFRERLRSLIDREHGKVAVFLKETGLDRSALGQFLDPAVDRLPRAETLRRIAETQGVTVDWLLSLSNAPDGEQVVAPSVRIESARSESGESPINDWRREAAGMKLRYVPSSLPDMLWVPPPQGSPDPPERGKQAENVMEGFQLGDMDVEIAMPIQTLESLSAGTGIWKNMDVRARQRQLHHMAETCKNTFPTLRLHLFDGTTTYAAPFTVFGRIRAAIYLGEAYLVVTSAEQVNALSRLFDGLVRKVVVGPDHVHNLLADLAERTR